MISTRILWQENTKVSFGAEITQRPFSYQMAHVQNKFTPLAQLPRIAQMGHFVWLMVLWRVQAEWRSVSMECGEQCVMMVTGITMIPEFCADNWGTVSTQVQVSLFIYWGIIY